MARDDDGRKPMVPSTMRVIFGIIMIIVYVGMGVLLLINYFNGLHKCFNGYDGSEV